jgi:hypothetical protein
MAGRLPEVVALLSMAAAFPALLTERRCPNLQFEIDVLYWKKFQFRIDRNLFHVSAQARKL